MTQNAGNQQQHLGDKQFCIGVWCWHAWQTWLRYTCQPILYSTMCKLQVGGDDWSSNGQRANNTCCVLPREECLDRWLQTSQVWIA